MNFILTLLSAVLLFLSACTHLIKGNQDEKAAIYLQMSVDHMQEKEYNKALDACREALKISPEMPAAFNQFAIIYMETKRYEKAEEMFRKAIELRPEYPEALNNFGVLKNREEHFKEAIPLFEKALQIDSYSTPENAYTNLGFSYYRLGKMREAKHFHQKALDIMPQFCLGAKNMGDVYAKEKNYRRAHEFFEKAVLNCPLYQEAHYRLGLVLMKLGNRESAKNQLEKLVAKHKSGPFVDRSQEVLKLLQ